MKKAIIYVANRMWLILGIYAVSLVVAGETFALLEDKSFGDGLWWAGVTALTIGYGDLTPVTTAGRVAGFIYGHFWAFVIIPMIIANIILNLIENKHLFSDDEQKELMERLRRVEALVSDDHATLQLQISQVPTSSNPSLERTSKEPRP